MSVVGWVGCSVGGTACRSLDPDAGVCAATVQGSSLAVVRRIAQQVLATLRFLIRWVHGWGGVELGGC